jgi:hypothetical protein
LDLFSRNSNIPITFFEKHLALRNKRGEHDKVDWYGLSANSNIPVTFFEKYLKDKNNKVNWHGLSNNKGIPLFYNKKELINIIDKSINI